MSIVLLDHVNIATDRLEATKDFFVDVLGLSVGQRPNFEFPGYWLYAGGQDLVHLVGVEAGSGAEPRSPLDHFAFRTDDLEEMAARLDKHDIKYFRVEAPDGSRRQLFLRDPNNVTIEISCRSKATLG